MGLDFTPSILNTLSGSQKGTGVFIIELLRSYTGQVTLLMPGTHIQLPLAFFPLLFICTGAGVITLTSLFSFNGMCNVYTQYYTCHGPAGLLVSQITA